jgi:hypothetical protein
LPQLLNCRPARDPSGIREGKQVVPDLSSWGGWGSVSYGRFGGRMAQPRTTGTARGDAFAVMRARLSTRGILRRVLRCGEVFPRAVGGFGHRRVVGRRKHSEPKLAVSRKAHNSDCGVNRRGGGKPRGRNASTVWQQSAEACSNARGSGHDSGMSAAGHQVNESHERREDFRVGPVCIEAL